MNELCGIRAEDIARRCGVNVATARRWKRGASQMSKAAAMILSGDLGIFDPPWRGWVLRRGNLISPEGWQATPGDVLSIQLVQGQLAAYRAENRALRAEIDGIDLASFEEQPLPGVAPEIVASRG